MFTWTHPDDNTITITLPDPGDVPSGVWRKVRAMSDIDGMFSLIEAVADEPAMAALDALPVRMLGEVFKDWQGGAGPGESDGSSA